MILKERGQNKWKEASDDVHERSRHDSRQFRRTMKFRRSTTFFLKKNTYNFLMCLKSENLSELEQDIKILGEGEFLLLRIHQKSDGWC